MSKYKIHYRVDGINLHNHIDFEGTIGQLNVQIGRSLSGGILNFVEEGRSINIMVSKLSFYSIEELK